MPPAPVHLEIGRLVGQPLVIPNADRLAEAFFSLDRSSVGVDSYDAYTAHTPPNRIEAADVDRINGPMRARSKKATWEDVFAMGDLDWLADIDTDWDLLMSPEQWQGAKPVMKTALIGITAPGRNVSVSTKMMHLKRPKLFPVLDALVVESIGGTYYTGKFPDRRADRSLGFIEHLRGQGVASRAALEEIQTRLAAAELPRTITRILDALLWMTNPDSELAPIGAVITRWREEDGIA